VASFSEPLEKRPPGSVIFSWPEQIFPLIPHLEYPLAERPNFTPTKTNKCYRRLQTPKHLFHQYKLSLLTANQKFTLDNMAFRNFLLLNSAAYGPIISSVQSEWDDPLHPAVNGINDVNHNNNNDRCSRKTFFISYINSLPASFPIFYSVALSSRFHLSALSSFLSIFSCPYMLVT